MGTTRLNLAAVNETGGTASYGQRKRLKLLGVVFGIKLECAQCMTHPRTRIAGATVMLTRTTSDRRFLLRPGPLVNQVFGYCLFVAASGFIVADLRGQAHWPAPTGGSRIHVAIDRCEETQGQAHVPAPLA